MKTKSILYFYIKKSSFVVKDIDILRRNFDVIEFGFKGRKNWLGIDFFLQCLFLLKYLRSADLTITFFAGYPSFLPSLFTKLFRLPSIIIAGGTDCTSFPQLNYGNFRKQPLAWFTAKSFKWCSCIVPVHEKLMGYNYTYDSNFPSRQGIDAFCKGIKTPYRTVNNGYNSERWFCANEKKKNTFVTLAYGIGTPIINQLKGIDLIMSVVADFPDCQFIFAGVTGPELFENIPDNVKLIPPVSPEEIHHLFSTCEYYLQFSVSEGFPNSLSEAMLCECIPMGSDAGGIPDIIGDTGFILYERDIQKLKDMITLALAEGPGDRGRQARDRIKQIFPESRRAKELTEVVASLIKS